MESQLSAGALSQILDGGHPANPVLQIIGYKPMPATAVDTQASNTLHYRLMIGDGIRAHQYCVISNQDLVNEIQAGNIEKWSLIRATEYNLTLSENSDGSTRALIYIINMEVVQKGSLIGKKLTVNPANVQTTNISNGGHITSSSTMQPIPHNNRLNTNGAEQTQAQPYPIQKNNSNMFNNSPRPIRSSHENQTINISELTPYIGKWVIKGRVTGKSGIREYSNAKGAGKLFNFTLTDKTGEIKCTAFNADCERNFAYVEQNKVYILGRASVKNADKRYTTADFEITLNSDSLLEEVTDTAANKEIPMAKFNFISIGSLSSVPPTQPVDLIGAIISVSDVSTIMSKTKNKELKKRNLTIVDMSRHTISVTIWGDTSESFTGNVGDIFVTKAARLGTYGGVSASAGDCLFVNPDIPEVRKIKNWYSNLLDQNFTHLTNSQDVQGSGDSWRSLAQLKDMDAAKLSSSGGQGGGVYAKCKAMLMSVGKNPVYKCCPTEGCGKKLVDTQAGEMKCEKCQQTFTHYKHRFKTDIEIEDHTSSSWVTLWDEKAELLFDMKPDALERLMKMDNKEEYEKVITRPNFSTFLFTLRARVDTYNNEERVKLNVINIAPLEPVTFSKHIIEEIKSLSS